MFLLVISKYLANFNLRLILMLNIILSYNIMLTLMNLSLRQLAINPIQILKMNSLRCWSVQSNGGNNKPEIERVRKKGGGKGERGRRLYQKLTVALRGGWGSGLWRRWWSAREQDRQKEREDGHCGVRHGDSPMTTRAR